MLYILVRFELRMAFEEIPNGSLRVVALSPGPIVKGVGWHILDHRVENDTIASNRSEVCISLQLGQYMIVGMIAVQQNEHASFAGSFCLNLRDHLGCNARTLDHGDTPCHRMRFDRSTVVGPNIDIDSEHLRVRRTTGDRV